MLKALSTVIGPHLRYLFSKFCRGWRFYRDKSEPTTLKGSERTWNINLWASDEKEAYKSIVLEES